MFLSKGSVLLFPSGSRLLAFMARLFSRAVCGFCYGSYRVHHGSFKFPARGFNICAACESGSDAFFLLDFLSCCC